MAEKRPHPDSVTVVEKSPQTKTPSLFKVLLHNDDYTPMDLVTEILMKIFQKTFDEATHIMLTVHHKGVGVAGVYTREIAEIKVSQTLEFARSHEAPLMCTLEEA
jgi:ATP-dependent Clp protease adaptor protein ClpS